MDAFPPDAFLAAFPPAIRRLADELRGLVKAAVPDAVEAVRPGWRLIGYDVPAGRRKAYFAYVAPESEHIHLGFEHGVLLADPGRVLEGAHLGLRKVRYVTFRPGQPIPGEGPQRRVLERLTREAAWVAGLSREARLAFELDRDSAPDGAAPATSDTRGDRQGSLTPARRR
jgi:hypothetical protein